MAYYFCNIQQEILEDIPQMFIDSIYVSVFRVLPHSYVVIDAEPYLD
jgi:hypothetical protein